MRHIGGIFLLGSACLCVIGGVIALVEFFKTGSTSLFAFGVAMCLSGGSSLTVAGNLMKD